MSACSKDNGDSNPGSSSDDSSSGDDSGKGGDDSGKGDDSGASVDADKDGYDASEDCDDSNPAVHPGAKEVCDGIDNDCVGGIDDGVTTPFYADTDADGYGAGAATDACEAPKGYVADDTDCDDTTAAAYPGATEVCDGIDNNCDLATDEGVTTPFYMDGDSDGFGAGKAMDACSAPSGYVDNADDCDDASSAANPDASEVCDSIDNDCDGKTDDDDSSVTGTSTWYYDYDGDGYGVPWTYVTACDAPTGYVSDSTDCNDYDSSWHAYVTMYYDNDLDGYGEDYPSSVCWTSDYYAKVGGDCDTNNAAINPGATEICNDIDDDCDSYIDGDDKSIVYTTWYTDADEDGYGDDSTATDTCDPAAGSVALGGDCDDSAYLVSPGRSEYCDGIDNNCNGKADEVTDYVDWYRDDDGDHYGQDGDVINDCSQPAGYDLNPGDCDDSNADTNPGAEEVCGDGVDNECDGHVDNSCYFDVDGSFFTLVGTSDYNYVGYSVAGGDLNGDGIDDLIVGAPYANSFNGAVYIVNGGGAGGNITVADVDAAINASSYEYIGVDVTSADVDGDGYDDLLASGAYSNKVFYYMGPVTTTTPSSADATFSTSTYGSYGSSIAYADLDGDATPDTAIAEPYDYGSSYEGNVYIYFGTHSGSVSSSDVLIQGTTTYGYGGVYNVGDTDGDGIEELGFGAWYGGGSQQGETYVLSGSDVGSSSGTVSASSIALAHMTGDWSYDNFGYKMAGADFNNDGYADVFTAAQYADSTDYTGYVYAWLGPVSGTFAASSADVQLMGDVKYGEIGADLALADLTGDGTADLVVGGPYMDTYRGEAYVLQGPTTGAFDLTATSRMGGDDDATDYNGYLGYAVGTIGDWSGDGIDDVILGGMQMPYTDSVTHYAAGKTWVVASDSL